MQVSVEASSNRRGLALAHRARRRLRRLALAALTIARVPIAANGKFHSKWSQAPTVQADGSTRRFGYIVPRAATGPSRREPFLD
jgi:hypothetical protein